MVCTLKTSIITFILATDFHESLQYLSKCLSVADNLELPLTKSEWDEEISYNVLAVKAKRVFNCVDFIYTDQTHYYY